MDLIVCLDDRNGMSFAGRRQSKDRVLRQKMLEQVGDATLWMDSYSASQFESLPENVKISQDLAEDASAGEYCFLERGDLGALKDKLEDILIFRWNRHYPSDKKFPMELLEGRTLAYAGEFAGSSHERITLEVYKL